MHEEPVTVSITRFVDPAQARQFAAWARSGQDLMSTYPGYLGSGWVRPDPASTQWHMLYRFADAASLATWQSSDERAWWVASALGIVEHSLEERRTGIEGWFDTPSSVEVISPTGAVPPRWKQMVSIFLVFFPLSLLSNWALSPITGAWPLPLLCALCCAMRRTAQRGPTKGFSFRIAHHAKEPRMKRGSFAWQVRDSNPRS